MALAAVLEHVQAGAKSPNHPEVLFRFGTFSIPWVYSLQLGRSVFQNVSKQWREHHNVQVGDNANQTTDKDTYKDSAMTGTVARNDRVREKETKRSDSAARWSATLPATNADVKRMHGTPTATAGATVFPVATARPPCSAR